MVFPPPSVARADAIKSMLCFVSLSGSPQAAPKRRTLIGRPAEDATGGLQGLQGSRRGAVSACLRRCECEGALKQPAGSLLGVPLIASQEVEAH